MGSTKRVNQPVITINAMVRVGPWTIERVHHGEWRKCDRCKTDHKEVWVCTVDADEADVGARLKGQRTWRIGSTCGPTLMLVADEFWDEETKDLRRIVRLAVDASRVIADAKGREGDYLFLPNIIRNLVLLKQKLFPRRMQRVLRSHVNRASNELKREAAALNRPPSCAESATPCAPR
jgi:hypothetical protein